MEENPLYVSKNKQAELSDQYIANVRGRPKVDRTVLFSPQPKSIVAQLLLKKKKIDNTVSNLESIETLKESSSTCDGSEQPSQCYTCENCSYRCEDLKDYKKHIANHKQFCCDFQGCDYVCKLSSNLIKHKRVHTDERPYLCDRCSFRSNFINSLKVHRRIHTSERPYQCKHCNYKCNSSSNLKKHCLHRHPEISLECN